MTELEASYAWCRRICRGSKSSFFASFALLDPPRRRAMEALYAFARISDDLSDSSRELTERQADLSCWRQLVEQLGRETRSAQDPNEKSEFQPDKMLEYALLWPALSDSLQRYAIPARLLEDIVEGVSMDLLPRQPQDWAELEGYCYHVASAVGLACAHIWRSADAIPQPQAIDCGIAFQLTNILRDIAEDARVGRIYLPADLFAKHSVTADAWLAGCPQGNWKAMIFEVAQRAVNLYSSGWQTIHALTPDSQRMFSLMWRSYRALLDGVIERPDHLWSLRKVRLSRIRKAFLLSTHFVGPLYASLSHPCQTVSTHSLASQPTHQIR